MAGSNATIANTQAALKFMGYRIYPVAASYAGSSLSITFQNDGCDRAWCGERYLELSLYSGSTVVATALTTSRVDTISGLGASTALTYSLPTLASGVPTGAYDLCIGYAKATGIPDIQIPLTATDGNRYAIGSVTIS
jgi:hypothetical protein